MMQEITQSSAKTVGIFLPIRGEIDSRPLIEQCLNNGYEVGLPITGDFATPLIFRPFTSGTGVRVGR